MFGILWAKGKLGCSLAVDGIHMRKETWVALPLLMIACVLHIKYLLM